MSHVTQSLTVVYKIEPLRLLPSGRPLGHSDCRHYGVLSDRNPFLQSIDILIEPLIEAPSEDCQSPGVSTSESL